MLFFDVREQHARVFKAPFRWTQAAEKLWVVVLTHCRRNVSEDLVSRHCQARKR
jgi:hypothetical protein